MKIEYRWKTGDDDEGLGSWRPEDGDTFDAAARVVFSDGDDVDRMTIRFSNGTKLQYRVKK